MKENKEKNLIWWIIGGIIILGMGGFIIYKAVWGKNVEKTSVNQKPVENDNDSSQTNPPKKKKLEWKDLDDPERYLTYLLENRLSLKKYFVFNLQKEVKPGAVATNAYLNGNQVTMNNGRNVTPSLAKHLSKLTGEEKDLIVFSGKYTNETSEEWSKDKLDQKIKNGEEWYIIFDKSQINSEVCNYFSKVVGIGKVTFPSGIVLAVESEPEVQIIKTKKEALEFLKKNDPFFAESG